MSPNGQSKSGAMNIVPGMTGDPASYRSFLMQALNKLLPSSVEGIDVDKEKPVDK